MLQIDRSSQSNFCNLDLCHESLSKFFICYNKGILFFPLMLPAVSLYLRRNMFHDRMD